MPVQLNIWLLLFGALQGLLLSLVLLRKRVHREGYGFLLLYLLVLLMQIILKMADKAWLMENVRTTYSLSYKLPLLYGPLVYFFVRSLITGESRLALRDLLHLLPFGYSMVVMNLRFLPGFPASLLWPMYAWSTLVMELVSLIVYHLLAFRQWTYYTQQLRASHSEPPSFQLDWVRRFVLVSCSVTVCVSVFLFLLFYSPQYTFLRFGFVLLCFFIYWISYSALRQPALFTRISLQNDAPETTLPRLPVFVTHQPQKKYANSSLAEEEAERILSALEQCMLTQKLYARPDVTIECLAEAVQSNRHHLSQVLNERLQQSYYDYINQWRIEAAKNMLQSEAYANHKIAAIGYEAGFNSLSSFNDVFKKRTGLTPSQYKKQASEEKAQQRG